ncbi:MAG: hypothetical protein JNL08_07815 [Planctomycetes bacterium]|nr:hypothetical protein [Planctomycetota bacterium]
MRRLATVGACLWTAAAAIAQDDQFERVELRVAAQRPDGSVIVDRGRRDRIEPGDKVVLTPRNGQSVEGTVLEVDDRASRVEILDRNAVLPLGTKGWFLLPIARREAKPLEVPRQPQEPAPQPTQPAAEEEWRPGMPLLGSTRPPRAQERTQRVDGRVYVAGNFVRTQDTWSHSFARGGTDLDVGNVDGEGGTLHFQGEFAWGTETSEETDIDLKVFDLSWERGGDRWQPVHWQVGRFLPRDMPEFGLLDGGSVSLRREGGDRLGASVGWLPELDEDMESFADLQVAAWYVWNADVGERLSVALGYQRTWHRWNGDRDLFVLRTRYLPFDGWNVASALWLDLYANDDVLKNDSFGVTRANLSAGRRWAKEGGIDVAYDHEEYPETLRREVPQTIQPATLVDAHQDRLSLHLYRGDATRWFARATGWIDEEREGGAGELGFTIADWFGQGSRTGLAGFTVQGQYSSQIGGRVDHGGPFAGGRLDLIYELGLVHQEGFPNDRDDLLQHRMALLFARDIGDGWDCLLHVDATLWDDDLSVGLGFYLQRHF